jgi:hypothetical protein
MLKNWAEEREKRFSVTHPIVNCGTSDAAKTEQNKCVKRIQLKTVSFIL